MKNMHTNRYFDTRKTQRETVSANSLVVNSDKAIAPEPDSNPWPALIRTATVDLCPEALCGWSKGPTAALAEDLNLTQGSPIETAATGSRRGSGGGARLGGPRARVRLCKDQLRSGDVAEDVRDGFGKVRGDTSFERADLTDRVLLQSERLAVVTLPAEVCDLLGKPLLGQPSFFQGMLQWVHDS